MFAPVEHAVALGDPQLVQMLGALHETREGKGVVELVGEEKVCAVARDFIEGPDERGPIAWLPGDPAKALVHAEKAGFPVDLFGHGTDQTAIPAADVHDRAQYALVAAHEFADEPADRERKNGAQRGSGDVVAALSDAIFGARVVPEFGVVKRDFHEVLKRQVTVLQ